MADYVDVMGGAVIIGDAAEEHGLGIISTYPGRSYLLTWTCGRGTTHTRCTSEFIAPVAPQGIAITLAWTSPSATCSATPYLKERQHGQARA